MNDDQFLTPREAAKVAQISYRKILDLVASDQIGFMRFGRAIRFQLSDLKGLGYKNGSSGELNKRYSAHK